MRAFEETTMPPQWPTYSQLGGDAQRQGQRERRLLQPERGHRPEARRGERGPQPVHQLTFVATEIRKERAHA
jgi:hypothetical protein